jgi:hypothetical protein
LALARKRKHEMLAILGGNGLPSPRFVTKLLLQEFMQDWVSNHQ